MGLDNIPIPIPCKELKLPIVFDEDENIACERVEGCPFSESDHPYGAAFYKCGYRGAWLDEHLRGTGADDLARKCYQSTMNPEEAFEFAIELGEHADSLVNKEGFDGVNCFPKGIDWDTGEPNNYEFHSSPEDTINLIRKAASWYWKIADLGSEVIAYY